MSLRWLDQTKPPPDSSRALESTAKTGYRNLSEQVWAMPPCYCAWPRDVHLFEEKYTNFASIIYSGSHRNRKSMKNILPFKTCTRILATIAFEGLQLYFPVLWMKTESFWVSKTKAAMFDLLPDLQRCFNGEELSIFHRSLINY